MPQVRPILRRAFAGACLAAVALSPALAWDAPGHRMITLLALDALPSDAPAFLREDRTRRMAASQSCEPDRWRGLRSAALASENELDHYFDIDMLPKYDLTYETMPTRRYDAIEAMARARAERPERFEPVDEARDIGHSGKWPGLLPHAIAEHYDKLRASFRTLRILERIADPARAAQLEQERANVVYHLGMLSHFVGDGSQPLHTTIHHHGWVGENPEGYTTDRGFHAKIDGGVIERHRIAYASLRPLAPAQPSFNPTNPWGEVRTYLERSHSKVAALYQLEKDGDLERDAGRRFIEERLADAGAMLGALYRAAWESSTVNDKDVADFIRYDKFEADTPEQPGANAGAPAR